MARPKSSVIPIFAAEAYLSASQSVALPCAWITVIYLGTESHLQLDSVQNPVSVHCAAWSIGIVRLGHYNPNSPLYIQ